nr:hypothetical protein [uncultured Hyphomonas sp.]
MLSKPEIASDMMAKDVPLVRRNSRKASAPKLIMVLGMHRSGTSVATRGVHALGADLGDNLMKPVANNNDKGFWEDLDFYRMNERVLAKAKSGWHYLYPLDTALFQKSEFAAERIEAAELLNQKLRKASVFAVKDPRTAVLLPFWQCVMDDLGVEPSYLITLRNPLETAESLRKRDGFDRHKGLVLWLKHTYEAIKGTEQAKRLFVSYQNLMADPRGELERIAEAFGLNMPSDESDAFKDYASDFLDTSMHHNRISANELRRDEAIPAPIPELYDLVSVWCGFDPDEATTLPEDLCRDVGAYFNDRDDFLGYSDRVETTLASVRKQVKDAELKVKDLDTQLTESKAQSARKTEELETLLKQKGEQLEDAQVRLAELEARASHLGEELKKAESASEGLVSQLAAARSDRQLSEQRVAASQEELAKANAGIAKLSGERDTMRAEMSDAKAHIDRLKGNLATHTAELAHSVAKIERLTESAAGYEAVIRELRKDLRLQRASLLELRNSSSWRLTRPLRGVKALAARSVGVVRKTGGSENDV